MFRLLKYLVILKLLNPFQRGFSFLRFFGCLVVAGGLLFYYGVPDWLSGMVRQAVGGQTETARHTAYGGNRNASSGGILGEMLGEGEKTVGGILDNMLKRDPKPQAAPAPADSGILSELLGKGGQTVENILAGAFGPGKKTPGTGYGPPAGFSGGTVTANPELFAAFARHGVTAAQLRSIPDSPMPPARKPDSFSWQTVQSIVDGDTLVVAGQKVRLVGIDAPEIGENDHLAHELNRIGARDQKGSMLYMGRTAADFVRKLAEGKRCWLEPDEGGKDQYGRILAYVHLEDGTNLNEAVLYQGYAKAYLGANFRYLKRYIFLQDEAMRRGNGLWGGNR